MRVLFTWEGRELFQTAVKYATVVAIKPFMSINDGRIFKSTLIISYFYLLLFSKIYERNKNVLFYGKLEII